MSVDRGIPHEQIEILEHELQKINVLSAEGVRIEKITPIYFKQICE